MEPDGGRVVAGRVAAGRDRGQEQQRRPQVVEQDQQDRQEPGRVGERGPVRAEPASANRRWMDLPASRPCSRASLPRPPIQPRRRSSLRRTRRWRRSRSRCRPGRRATEPQRLVHGRQGGGEVAAAVLVVDGQLAQGPAVARLAPPPPRAGRAAAWSPARLPRAARRRSERTRSAPAPVVHHAAVLRLAALVDGGALEDAGQAVARRAGPRRGPPRPTGRPEGQSAASDTTSSRLCSSTRGQRARVAAAHVVEVDAAGSPRPARRRTRRRPSSPASSDCRRQDSKRRLPQPARGLQQVEVHAPRPAGSARGSGGSAPRAAAGRSRCR